MNFSQSKLSQGLSHQLLFVFLSASAATNNFLALPFCFLLDADNIVVDGLSAGEEGELSLGAVLGEDRLGLRSMLIGNILGLGLCLLQAHTHMISLDPSSYYLDTVPIEIIPTYIILLNIGTLILTTLMLIGPSFVISRILPAKSIRFN